MDNMLRAKEQEAMENANEIQRLNKKNYETTMQFRSESEKVINFEQKITDILSSHKDLEQRHLNAKKGYHLIKETLQKVNSQKDEAAVKIEQIESEYYPLKEKYDKLLAKCDE